MDKINIHNYEAYFLDFAEGNLDEETKKEVLEFVRLHPELKEELEAFEIIELPGDDASHLDWAGLKKEKNYESSEELRDELFFKAAEGEVSPEEKEILLGLITNEQFKSEYELWQRLTLSAQEVDFDKSYLYNLGLDKEINESNYEHFLIARLEGLLNNEQNEKLERFATFVEGGPRNLQITDSLKLKAPKGIFYPDKESLYQKEQSAGLLIWFTRAAAVAALLVLGYFLITNYESGTERQYAERPAVEKIEEQNNSLAESVESETKEDQGAIDIVLPEEDNSNQETQSVEEIEIPQAMVAETIELEFEDAPQNEDDSENPELIQELDPKPISIAPELVQSDELAKSDIPEILTEDTLSTPEISPDIEDYKTIPEITEDYLASTFEIDNEEQGFLPTLGQRIADKAGDALNAEVRKDESKDATKYTFKIGGFKVTRTNSR